MGVTSFLVTFYHTYFAWKKMFEDAEKNRLEGRRNPNAGSLVFDLPQGDIDEMLPAFVLLHALADT